MAEMKPRVIAVSLKPPRSRGATWTDNQVRWLLQIWSRPEILQQMASNKCVKHELYESISSELALVGITRSAEEIRSKIKNMKMALRLAKKAGTPSKCKYYVQLQKILDKIPKGDDDQEDANANSSSTNHFLTDPVHIEFQLMDCDPSTSSNSQPIHIVDDDDDVFDGDGIPHHDDLNENSSQPVIVFTTTTAPEEANDGVSKRPAVEENNVKAKRQKLQKLGDKLADRVTQVLAQSTDSLIAEMKRSEEQFMRWEEQRRKEERVREEAMIKRLIKSIQIPVQQTSSGSGGGGIRCDTNAENEEVDSLTEKFDKAAEDLRVKMEAQWGDIESSVDDWERRMGRQEINHTQSLFNILLHSLNPKP